MNQEDWVDSKLGTLHASNNWEPDLGRAFALLRSGLSADRERKRARRWILPAVVVAASLAIATGIPRFSLHSPVVRVSADVRTLKNGDAPPDFARDDASGVPVRLSAYRGKVVVVNFWATWCGGCKEEIPGLDALARKYKERGLAVLGISMDDDGWKSVKPYLRAHPLAYPVVIGDEALGARFGLAAMPMTVVLNRQGRVAATHVGVVDGGALEREIIRQLLP